MVYQAHLDWRKHGGGQNTLLLAIRTALVNIGIIKGSA